MLEHYRSIEQDLALKTYRMVLASLSRLTVLRHFDFAHWRGRTWRAWLTRSAKKAHLVALNGSDVLLVYRVDCDSAVRATDRTGQRLPLPHGRGKDQLAQPQRISSARCFRLSAWTRSLSDPITSRTELLRELKKAKRLGYATNRRESEQDIHAVAAAIVDKSEWFAGSRTVSGPPERMPPRRCEDREERARSEGEDLL